MKKVEDIDVHIYIYICVYICLRPIGKGQIRSLCCIIEDFILPPRKKLRELARNREVHQREADQQVEEAEKQRAQARNQHFLVDVILLMEEIRLAS